MDAEPSAKRPRLSQGEPPLLAGEPTADAILPGDDAPPPTTTTTTTTDTLPDEEHAAPPSSAAGAHAKPLSAIWAAKSPSPRKKKQAVDLKGKGKARAHGQGPEDDDKENFTTLLERLEAESASLCSAHSSPPRPPPSSSASSRASADPSRALLLVRSFDRRAGEVGSSCCPQAHPAARWLRCVPSPALLLLVPAAHPRS